MTVTAGPGDNEWKKLAEMREEFGEVSRALVDRSFGADTIEHIEEELIQVAAVAVAWVEYARAKRSGLRQPESHAQLLDRIQEKYGCDNPQSCLARGYHREML